MVYPSIMIRALKLGPILAGLGLASCASTSHVTAFQEAPIAPSPRTFSLALDQGEKLPFGMSPDAVATAARRAGFTMQADTSRYRLALTAAVASSKAGSYLPGEETPRPSWLARPDRSWRAHFTKGRTLRVTAVLVETGGNREVWRGTGTLRTADPKAAAPTLVEEVLARLPSN
jgi:hypothetical protein